MHFTIRYGVCSCPSPLILQGSICVEKEDQVAFDHILGTHFKNYTKSLFTSRPVFLWCLISEAKHFSNQIYAHRSLGYVLLLEIVVQTLTVCTIEREVITGRLVLLLMIWWHLMKMDDNREMDGVDSYRRHVDDDIAIGANAWEVTMATASIVSPGRTLTAAF